MPVEDTKRQLILNKTYGDAEKRNSYYKIL